MQNLNLKSLNLLKLIIVLSIFAFIGFGCGGGGGDEVVKPGGVTPEAEKLPLDLKVVWLR